MGRLVWIFFAAVVVLAATDTTLTRLAAPHRPVEVRLFIETLALWSVFALLASVPALVTVRVRARRLGAQDSLPAATLHAAAALAFWAALPVVLHRVMDSFTGQGQDVTRLKQIVPWLIVSGVVLGFSLAFWLVVRLLGRISASGSLVSLVLVGAFAGLFLPLRRAASVPVGAGDTSAKPNLMLLVWDTCRADHTQPYGYGRGTTPNLARFADESIVFEEARSATIFTFSSHLTMLTGVMPSVHGGRLVNARYDPRKSTTIAESLRAAGYRTGGFVGTDVLAGRTGLRHGFEVYRDLVDPAVCDTRAWKLVHDAQSVLAMFFPGLRNNGRPHWFQDFQRPAPKVLAEALEWIRDEDPRPWFCMINLYDAHWPYLPGPEARDALVRDYNGAFDGYLFRSDSYVGGTQPRLGDVTHLRDLYDAELLELDGEVASFLSQIDLDRTGVLITSDHGEAFGEAGTWKHESLYEPQLRVPMLLRLPGASRSGRVRGRAGGLDVAPTLLAMAGVPAPPDLVGVDLTRSTPDPGRVLLVEDGDHRDPGLVNIALYRGPWKLMREGRLDNLNYSLHHLERDPVGQLDVSDSHPLVRAEMVALLEQMRGDLDKEMAAQDSDLGAAASGLKALGYLDGDD